MKLTLIFIIAELFIAINAVIESIKRSLREMEEYQTIDMANYSFSVWYDMGRVIR